MSHETATLISDIFGGIVFLIFLLVIVAPDATAHVIRAIRGTRDEP